MPRGSCKNTGCVYVCLEAKNINKFNAIDLKKRVKIRFQAGKVGTLLSTCIVIEYASSGNLAKNMIFHTIETHR